LTRRQAAFILKAMLVSGAEVSPVPTDAHSGDATLLAFDLPQATVRVRGLRESDTRLLEWHGGADLRSFYERQWWAHNSNEAFVLVADFNGFPIGQAAIYWVGKPMHPHLPDLQSLRVHPIFQGQGIGSRLLEAGAMVVQARGLPHLSLSVGVHNHRARQLYGRCGYHVSSEPYEDSWQYQNAKGETVVVTELVLDMLKEV
jgi:ribosomal protein S18 acetylase RimI-like enzyme